MAECIVCGEKIEDGQQYCSVCAPEPHGKLDSTDDINTEGLSDDQSQVQENKIEIKKDPVILDDEDSENEKSLDPDQGEDS